MQETIVSFTIIIITSWMERIFEFLSKVITSILHPSQPSQQPDNSSPSSRPLTCPKNPPSSRPLAPSNPRICRRCHTQYSSGNELFRHLREGCPSRRKKKLDSEGEGGNRSNHLKGGNLKGSENSDATYTLDEAFHHTKNTVPKESLSNYKTTPRTCRHCQVQYGTSNALHKHLRAGCEAAPVKHPSRMTKTFHSDDTIHRPSHKKDPATPVQSVKSVDSVDTTEITSGDSDEAESIQSDGSVESGVRITPNEPSHHHSNEPSHHHFDESPKLLSHPIDESPKPLPPSTPTTYTPSYTGKGYNGGTGGYGGNNYGSPGGPGIQAAWW